jgi:hypothetical protein
MPIMAIHPGEHLAEELEELGMSAAELALGFSTASAQSLVIPPYGWAISSVPARSFG